MHTQIFSDFNTLPRVFRDFMEDAADSSFDQSLVWFETLARTVFTRHDEIRLIGVSDSDAERPIAILPILLRRQGSHPFKKVSIHSLSNYYTAHFGPVCAPDADIGQLAICLSKTLLDIRPKWQMLDFNPLDDKSSLIAEISRVLASSGVYVQRYFRFGNWYLDVTNMSFDEYFNGLPSKLRNTLNRKCRKLTREAEVEIQIICDETGLDNAFESYSQIYARSWKRDEPYPEFIEDIGRKFAKLGWLRLGLVNVNGEPAAAQLWFVHNDTASIFKLAYDPKFSTFSVGSILTKEMMKHVIDNDAVRIVDYLCGDDSYKRDWMSNRRERIGIRAYRMNTVRGALGAARARTGKIIRAMKGSQESVQ